LSSAGPWPLHLIRTLTAAGGGPPPRASDDASIPSWSEPRFPFLIADRYLVERELGRGGMGRVLLAEDRRLKRRVAIKIVGGAGSRHGMARLEREARLVASLGHQNILQVHDVGRFEAGPYVVEEYVEGRTLRQLLDEGVPSVAESVGLAAQAAHGLAAAHERGVVHCDLKPENLLVTAARQLKILDFGIARLNTGPAPEEDKGSERELPERGFTGTLPYSSPEQASCAPFDHRSDLFSLGVVLHELLCGEQPFRGTDAAQTAYAVMRAPAPPLPKTVPSDVQRIVARCLEKEPQNRFATAAELAAALDAARERITARIWPRRVATLALMLLAATAAVFLWTRFRRDDLVSYHQITFLPGAIWTARFAPDGATIYYTEAFDGAQPRIFSTRIGSPEHHRLEIENAVLLGVSLRGELAFLRAPLRRGAGFTGTLATVPAPGGEPRDVLENVDEADWAPSGGSLAVVRRVPAGSQLEYPIGTVLFRTGGWISDARVSPDGERVAFVHHPRTTGYAGDVRMVDRAGHVVTLSGPWGSASGASWSSDGSEILFGATGKPGMTGGTPLSLRAVTPGGKEREITRGAGHLEILDVSREGRVAAILPRRILGIAVSRPGSDRDLSLRDEQILHDLAPDGSRILFTTNPRTPSGEGAIFVRGVDGGAAVQIATGYGGTLSPDGRHALIFPMPGSSAPLSLVSLAAGESRSLRPNRLGAVYRGRFLADGRRVLLAASEDGHAMRLWLLSLPDDTVTAVSEEGISASHLAISAGMAAAVDSQGALKLYPYDGAPARPVPGAREGEAPYGFLRDGGLVLGRDSGETELKLDRLNLKTGRRTQWKTLRSMAPGASIGRVLLSNGEEVIAYSHESWKTHLYLLEGVK
jgi:eukaryotic-like serine/threonine-protein kinase